MICIARSPRRAGPYRGNRVVALVSKLCSLAVQWRWRVGQPVKRNRAQRRRQAETIPDPPSSSGLSAALADTTTRRRGSIPVLASTGARRGEVRPHDGLTSISKPAFGRSRRATKTKTDHVVPLSAPGPSTVRRPGDNRTESEFCSRAAQRRAPDRSQRNWARVCKAAGILGCASTTTDIPMRPRSPVPGLGCTSSVGCSAIRSRQRRPVMRICLTTRCARRPSAPGRSSPAGAEPAAKILTLPK